MTLIGYMVTGGILVAYGISLAGLWRRDREPKGMEVTAIPGPLPNRPWRWSARGRFLYQDNEPVGLMDSPDLTAAIVEKMNS